MHPPKIDHKCCFPSDKNLMYSCIVLTVGMDSSLLKGVLHLLPKINMFFALSQNNQQLFGK